MLVIKIELHSAIDHSVKELGRAYLCNDGTGTNSTGNYDLRIMRQGVTDQHGQVWKTGRVTGFKRNRENCWKLLFFALSSMLSGKIKELI